MTDSPVGRFKTHANYIRALAVLAGNQVWPMQSVPQCLNALAVRTFRLPSMADPTPATQNLAQIRSSLENAWGTELLLGLAGHFGFADDLVRLTNNWAVVQTYYVAYHATQAYSGAKGQPRPDSHPKTQNEFGARWLQRPIELAPWTFGATHGGFTNVPTGTVVDTSIHGWSACNAVSAWGLAGKAFESTRNGWIDEAVARQRAKLQSQNRKVWREKEATRLAAGKAPRTEPKFPLPRLSAPDRASIASGMRPAGFIDYLYRLRIKTNYEDSSMFTDGPDDAVISGQVHSDLTYLATSTLLVHELHIGRLVGKATLLGWVDQWLTAHLPTGMVIGLAGRRHTLDATL